MAHHDELVVVKELCSRGDAGRYILRYYTLYTLDTDLQYPGWNVLGARPAFVKIAKKCHQRL